MDEETTYKEFTKQSANDVMYDLLGLQSSSPLDGRIMEDDTVISLMAGTNTYGWTESEHEINAMYVGGPTPDIVFSVVARLDGEQREDTPPCGDQISVFAVGRMKLGKEGWEVDSLQVLSADVLCYGHHHTSSQLWSEGELVP